MQRRLTRGLPGSPLPGRRCGHGRGPSGGQGSFWEGSLLERHLERTSGAQPGVNIRSVRGRAFLEGVADPYVPLRTPPWEACCVGRWRGCQPRTGRSHLSASLLLSVRPGPLISRGGDDQAVENHPTSPSGYEFSKHTQTFRRSTVSSKGEFLTSLLRNPQTLVQSLKEQA